MSPTEGEEASWWVVVNPSVGQGVVGRTRRVLDSLRIEAHVVATGDGSEVAEVVRSGIGQGFRRFVAVGGDGTANMVADALLACSLPEPPVLGILPAGTGCDFVRTFGISQQLEQAARHLLGSETYRADAGLLAGAWGARHFLNVAEAGVGAATVRTAARLPKRWKRGRYHVAFWLTLPRFPSTEVDLLAGRRRYQGPANNLVFANAQFFGQGMNVAPRANLVDGRLDVQIFTGPRRSAVALVPRIRRGLHLTHPSLRRFSVPEFRLTTERPWPVEADGEYLGLTPVAGSVLAGAIDIKL